MASAVNGVSPGIVRRPAGQLIVDRRSRRYSPARLASHVAGSRPRQDLRATVMDYGRARLNMVANQLRPNRIEDPRVLAAMGAVPRERFVPKSLLGVAYADEDLRLPDGRFLIEPLALARLLQSARIAKEDVLLIVGCATGYAGAVAARLAATVILMQSDAAAAAAVERLLDELGADNVVVAASPDPLAGHPSQAPFDAILLAGAVPAVPAALLGQLGESGRLVAVVEAGRIGKGTLFSRMHGVIGQRVLFDARIAPMPGAPPAPAFAF
jgi:protein-L-isoaspartate(D-aspartate) O-methyltransferase